MKQSARIRHDDAIRAVLFAAWLALYLMTH